MIQEIEWNNEGISAIEIIITAIIVNKIVIQFWINIIADHSETLGVMVKVIVISHFCNRMSAMHFVMKGDAHHPKILIWIFRFLILKIYSLRVKILMEEMI